MKSCGNCGVSKPFTEFAKNKGTKSGLSCYCKVCLRLKGKQRYSSTKEVNRKRISRYGIDTTVYEKMFLDQQGMCAICTRKFPWLCIDHDHVNKVVRGLLCRSCNGLLGRAGEKLDVLLGACTYLVRSKK